MDENALAPSAEAASLLPMLDGITGTPGSEALVPPSLLNVRALG